MNKNKGKQFNTNISTLSKANGTEPNHMRDDLAAHINIKNIKCNLPSLNINVNPIATQCSTSTIHTRKMPNIIDRTQIRKMAPALRTRVATGPFDLVDSFDLTELIESTAHSLHNINVNVNHIYIIFFAINNTRINTTFSWAARLFCIFCIRWCHNNNTVG